MPSDVLQCVLISDHERKFTWGQIIVFIDTFSHHADPGLLRYMVKVWDGEACRRQRLQNPLCCPSPGQLRGLA